MSRLILTAFIFLFIISPTRAEEVKVTYPNGNIKSLKIYQNGKLNGISKYYNENGRISAEILFVNGQAEVLKEFYANGKLETEFYYKNKKRNGPQKIYYATGNLKSEWIKVNEVNSGAFTYYYKNKQIHYTGIYNNGELEGVVQLFYKNGSPEALVSYHKGKWHGDSKEYYENGAIKSVATFENGKGLEKRFYKSGELKEETPYVDDDKNGIAIGFYKSGELKYEDSYKNDQLIYRKSYSKEGELNFQQDYSESWFWQLVIHLVEDSSNKKPDIKTELTDEDEIKSKSIIINKSFNIYHKESYEDGVLKSKDIIWGKKKINHKKYDKTGKLLTSQNYIFSSENDYWIFLWLFLAFIWIRWVLKNFIKDGVKEALEDSHYTLKSIIEDSRG